MYQTHCCSVQENTAPNPLAKEELNFLARLMGGLEIKKPHGSEAGFRLNLFTTDEEEEYDQTSFVWCGVVKDSFPSTCVAVFWGREVLVCAHPHSGQLMWCSSCTRNWDTWVQTLTQL